MTVEIPAARDEVWQDVANLATHVEWMADAESLTFTSEREAGVGTEAIVATKIGPFRTSDRMRFTVWEPPHRMGVEHIGLFTGTGEFTLEAIDESSTRFSWIETIRFPWYLGGPIGAFFAQPILRAVWRRNLKRLRNRFSDR